MTTLHHNLRQALADRHSPEAAHIFGALYPRVCQRAGQVRARRWSDVLTDADVDEIVAEVMYTLVEGALARFRGQTSRELYAFVRTMTDRVASRRAQRVLRERTTVEQATTTQDAMFARAPAPPPDARAEVDPKDPLEEADQIYLEALIQAGSKAALARQKGTSRAAVTQRLQRIRARVASLPAGDRDRHRAWLLIRAREAVRSHAEDAEPVEAS